MANRTFTVVFQDGNQKDFDTNDEGMIRMVKPGAEFSLTSEIDGGGSEENKSEKFYRYKME